VLSRAGMVCASVPQAAAAGAAILSRGGNAMDAALATAATLCVTEPMQTGLGGDAFALFWSAREGRLLGLNGSGRAPARATPERYRAAGCSEMPRHGILSVTVPGAVHAWEELSRNHGRLPLGDCLEPAIRAAREGFAVSELVAHYWRLLVQVGALRNDAARATLAPEGRAPAAGERFRNPRLAATLEAVARDGARGFYRGPVADAMVAAAREEDGLLAHADLEAHTSTWVEPLRTRYRGVEVAELPPNGQGLAALLGLDVLGCFEPAPPWSALGWHRRIEAAKLALADCHAHVADPDFAPAPLAALLDAAHARRQAARIGDRALDAPAPGLAGGDTTCLCAADADGNMVSFIQSLFGPFGSGVGCGATGVVLQNRGAGFRLEPRHPGVLAPRKRPYHTIIPGFLLRRGAPWMAFGIMGGDIQPQAHLAFVSDVVDHGLNPQEALDRPRFRWHEGRRVSVEQAEAPVEEGGTLGAALAARGHQVEPEPEVFVDLFGGGQAIAREHDGLLVGASDRRKDGCASGVWT